MGEYVGPHSAMMGVKKIFAFLTIASQLHSCFGFKINDGSDAHFQPDFHSMSPKESAIAQSLWKSFEGLTKAHEDFHTALEDNQRLQNTISSLAPKSTKKKDRFLQVKSRIKSGTPTDEEMIQNGNYATQNPRGPAAMRILDGEKEEQIDKNAVEEAQKSVAAAIEQSVEEAADDLAEQSAREQRDRSIRNEAFTIQNTMKSVAKRREEEKEYLPFSVESKAFSAGHRANESLMTPKISRQQSRKGSAGSLPCAEKQSRFIQDQKKPMGVERRLRIANDRTRASRLFF